MPREEEVKQRNDGTCELRSTANVDGGRGEGLPEDNDEGGDDELDDDEKANAGAEVRRPSAESAL